MPLLARCVVVAAVLGAVVGGAVGLGIGLAVYPPTAWFAILEIGIPSFFVCAIVGLLVGATWRVIGVRRPSVRA
jgi:hypothetical protein